MSRYRSRPRPTVERLSRLSNEEMNALTKRYPNKGARGKEVGSLGRISKDEYKKMMGGGSAAYRPGRTDRLARHSRRVDGKI